MICPRCGSESDQDHYGPCAPCRAQLRADAAAAAAARRAAAVAGDSTEAADRALQGQERAIGS